MTQGEIDLVVARIRKLVAHYDDDGYAPPLDKLRAAYTFFHAAPGDAMGFVLLVDEVDAAEKVISGG